MRGFSQQSRKRQRSKPYVRRATFSSVSLWFWICFTISITNYAHNGDGRSHFLVDAATNSRKESSNALAPLHHPIKGTSTRKNSISRRLQSMIIQHRATPKPRAVATPPKSNESKHFRRGSVVSWFDPTPERLVQWFGPEDEDLHGTSPYHESSSPSNGFATIRGMLKREFNHDCVGMTNPCIRLLGGAKGTENASSSTKPSSAVQLVSNTMCNPFTPDWWPSLSFTPKDSKKWRVLTYRKCVGHGIDCYRKVRDASLQWKFVVSDKSETASAPSKALGMLPVPSSIPTSRPLSRDPPNLPKPFVARSRYVVIPNTHNESTLNSESPNSLSSPSALYDCIGAGRRFVTFTSKRILPFLPKIYSVNPVMLVYDVVDQRGPATTYTSTAYATMKGHLLRGEERVTVALRDETQEVHVEIVSLSRPAANSLKATLVWPFLGNLQDQFFKEQLQALEDSGR